MKWRRFVRGIDVAAARFLIGVVLLVGAFWDLFGRNDGSFGDGWAWE